MKGLYVLLLLCAFISGSAQVLVEGQVRELNGDSISFATINFKTDSSLASSHFAIADRSGRFLLRLPAGISKGLIEVSAVGFATQVFPMVFSTDKVQLEAGLRRQQHALAPLYVKADNAIQVSGDTISFRAESFRRGNEHNIGNLLSNMPGFRVDEQGRISFNGTAIDNILIQGDDLTGNDYDLLVKKLGVNGVDKIQVIRNYRDPANILSKFSRSSRQVLNINFKSSYQSRFFGTAKAGGAASGKEYALDDQVIGLMKDIKLLDFQGINNIGETQKGDANASIFRQKLTDENDPFNEMDLPENLPLAMIPGIENPFHLPQSFSSKRTAFSSIDLLLRPSKDLSVKGRSSGIWDRMRQQVATLDQIFLPTGTINMDQNRSVIKKRPSLQNALFLNWRLNPRNQLALLLKSDNGKIHDQATGDLQATNFQERVDDKDNRYGAKLIFNRLLGNLGHSALAFDLQYTRQRLQGYYRQQPNNYDSFFFKSVNIEDLGQHESQFKWDAAFHGAYIARTLHHSYSVQLSGSKTSNQLTNDIAANENTLPVYSDSGNNYQFQTEKLGIKLEDAWKCTDRFTLTGRLTAEKQWYNLRQLHSSSFSKKYSRLVWLPALFAELKLSQKDQLTISGTVQSVLPDIAAMAPGYTINQLTVIRQGADSFLMRTYPTVQLVFSHFAMAQHGFLFFTGISYSSNPYLILPNQYPNSYYTYSRYQTTDRSGANFSIFTRGEKFLSGWHMRIEPELVFFAGRNYSMIEAIISQTRFQQYKAGISGSITVGKIQTQAGSSYTLNRQQRQSAGEQPGYLNTAQWENKMKISWNISPRLFLDVQGLNNVLYPHAQKAQSVLLADAEISYHFKNERWVVGCQATNLLDKRNFAESFVTPFSSVYNNYSLFHRVVLGYVRFSF